LKKREAFENAHTFYLGDKAQYQNIRLNHLINPQKSNPKLAQFLQDKSQYDTASFGETSADELYLKTASSEGEHNVQIFR